MKVIESALLFKGDNSNLSKGEQLFLHNFFGTSPLYEILYGTKDMKLI